jgi:hypothetical protein
MNSSRMEAGAMIPCARGGRAGDDDDADKDRLQDNKEEKLQGRFAP